MDTAREYSYRDDVPAPMPWGRESVDREDVLRYASIGAGTCSVYPDIDNLHLVASIGRRRWDLCKRKEGWGGTFVCIDVRSAQLGADEPAQRVPAPGPRHPGRHAGRAGAADSLHHFLPVTLAPCDPHAFWNPPMRLAEDPHTQ